MKIVDARGYACPQPVIMTKKALENNGAPLQVLVDRVLTLPTLQSELLISLQAYLLRAKRKEARLEIKKLRWLY